MQRTGNLALVGEENVLLAGHVLGSSTSAGYEAGSDWLLGAEPAGELLEPEAPGNVVPQPAVAPPRADGAGASEGPESVFSDRASVLARVVHVAQRSIPWRDEAKWQATIAAGLILLITGLVGVLFPGVLDGYFRGLAGLILIAVSSFWIYLTFTDRGIGRMEAGGLRMLSAGVAMMAGGGLVFAEFVHEMSTDSARLLLGFGLILIGVAGLFAAWFLPEGIPDRLAAIVMNGLVIAFGAISLFAERPTALLRATDVAHGRGGRRPPGVCVRCCPSIAARSSRCDG